MKLSRLLVILTVITLLLYACGSDVPDKKPSSNQRKNTEINIDETKDEENENTSVNFPFDPDSVTLILESVNDNKAHFVFIDKRKHSEFFTNINSFDLPTKFEISQYRNSFDKLKKFAGDSIPYFSNKGDYNVFCKEWIELFSYKSEYYLYCPFRSDQNFRLKITDTTIISFDTTGIYAEAITSFKRDSKDKYEISTLSAKYLNTLEDNVINVYVVNESRGIYVWESFTAKGLEYRLMTCSDKMRNFPIIVNYATGKTPNEYKFERINFISLINDIVQNQ